ncbi:MAG: NAD(P)-binding domain-containing protein, partial [Deltaproteobacteria bacterium]|nr:NAD(P)-binding domain-containing protein [Deltaproteobacteria bacterium]
MAAVTVLGAGAFGTALAIVLARSGHAVKLAVRRKSQLATLRHDRENRAYLSAVQFPSELHLAEMGIDCIRDVDAVVMAIPSGFARETLAPMASAIPRESLVISVSKGIEQDSLRTMSQMLAELAPPADRIAVL